MTIEQKNKVDFYKSEFEKMCTKYVNYNAKKTCNFNVYKSENSEDNNVTIVYSHITGVSDDYQTYFGVDNILIEPDGNAINMGDFYPQNDIIDYIEKLKKIT